jgi:hypothetical protein
MIVLTVTVLGGLFLYLLWHRLSGNQMKVITIDSEGRQVGKAEWVRIPDPERVPSDGIRHVETFVARLDASTAPFSSLTIFSPDNCRGLLLMRRNDQKRLCLTVEWRQEPEKENAIREFFRKRHIEPALDYLAGNGGIRDATRVLEYPIEGDVPTASELCIQILNNVCRIGENEPLNFTYQEDRSSRAT